MRYNRLGKTDLKISHLGFGASAVGGMFEKTDKNEAIKTIHTAFDRGINYFDTSPAYGRETSPFGAATSEIVLGEGLKSLKRDEFIISTKAGKTASLPPVFNFSYSAIIKSVESSLKRLNTDYIDIVFLHDIEYGQGQYLKLALTEGLEALRDLKKQGKIKFIGASCYPIEVLDHVITNYELDVILVHNHYTLINDLLLKLLPKIKAKDVGLVNASPFASGLLTHKGPPDWYPVNVKELAVIKKTIAYCKDSNIPIEKIALQFALRNSEINTTLFSCSNQNILNQNLDWSQEPINLSVIEKTLVYLESIKNTDFDFGGFNK
ncbi:aldo/keto reductase [Formosa sp. 4Alg 33]|uniref:aldo/keto reductase n=1 Tax=Formosa sp. 4Alg 33 TaxID=3382189 RepID=UPI003D9C206B